MTMSSIPLSPGHILLLDSTQLRTLGGSMTNAVLGPEGDRAVTDARHFLIVGVNMARTVCTAVPLFTTTAVGNQPLEESKKSGGADEWTGSPWYFSRWQHWRIPLASAAAASIEEPTDTDSPRRYAVGDSSTLDDIKNWETRNRAEYRFV